MHYIIQISAILIYICDLNHYLLLLASLYPLLLLLFLDLYCRPIALAKFELEFSSRFEDRDILSLLPFCTAAYKALGLL